MAVNRRLPRCVTRRSPRLECRDATRSERATWRSPTSALTQSGSPGIRDVDRPLDVDHRHVDERHGHHTLALRARSNLIAPAAQARFQRQAPGPIDLATARVLHRVLTVSRNDRAWDQLAPAHETDAARRLIAAGLIERCGAALQATPRCDATLGTTARPETPRLRALYNHCHHVT
jgi:hypothetical protein